MSSGQGWESVSQPTMPTLQDDLLEKLLGVANRAKSFTSAGGAAIALGSGKHFVVSATCGTSLDVGATVPLPSTLAGFRSLKSNALRYGDTDKEATIDGDVCRSARIKSMLVVPVGDLSDVGAVLAVFSSAVNAFTETHIAVLKTLAEVISNLLPEKAKLVETAPEKKTGELLEHPFDPTFDNLPKKVEVGSSPLNELSEPASAVLDSAMRAPRASLSPPVPPPAVEVLAGGDAYTNPAPAPPRVPKPPPAKASTPPTSGWRGPNAREVLNLAADPVVKRSSSAVAPARKRTSPRPSTGSGRAYKTRSYKRFFVVAVASLAILALLRLGYGYFLNRYMNTSEIVRTTVPSAAPSEHRQLASPFGTRTEHLGQTKGDVVGAATAASFSPTTNPIAIDSVPPQAVESRTLKPLRLDPIVVRQSSAPPPAALFRPQEERLPEVHVASTPAMVSEILRTSTPVVSAPTFKAATVVPSELVSKVAPTYPEGAKRFGIRGKVVVSARVTKTGSVTDVSAVSGPPLLQDAAISAVKKWRYKPSTSDGKPIDSKVEIVINFQTSN